MSTLFKPTNLLTYGYIRDIEESNPTAHLPNDVIDLIQSFIHNIYGFYGKHTWKVTDKAMVKQMLKSETGVSFKSPEFEMLRLKWRIVVFPNGDTMNNANYFVVGLHLVSLPYFVKKIHYFRVFRVHESKAGSAWSKKLGFDKMDAWSQLCNVSINCFYVNANFSINGKKYSRCPLQELIDLQCTSLTVSVEIKLVSLIMYKEFDSDSFELQQKWQFPLCDALIKDTIYSMEYKLEKEELQLFKNRPKQKSFASEVAHDTWLIEICPNTNNQLCLYLIWMGFPENVKTVQASGFLECKELDIYFSFNETLKCNKWYVGFRADEVETKSWKNEYDAITLRAVVIVNNIEVENEQINWTIIRNPIHIMQLLSN